MTFRKVKKKRILLFEIGVRAAKFDRRNRRKKWKGKMKDKAANTEPLDRFIRNVDLPQYVGMGRTKIQGLVLAGEFPPPMFIGNQRGKVWSENEIRKWQKEQFTNRANAKG